MAFSDAWMGELLAKNDIVTVVSQYVSLTRKSGRLWGRCPFHNEKTASFSVTPEKGLYYCFGCHKGGNAVTFISEIENLPTIDAIKLLAEHVGMQLPDEIDDEKIKTERALKNRLYSACRDAAVFYHESLMEDAGKAARSYLSARGMDGRTVKKFGIGFAPDGWDALTLHMKEQGYTEDELIKAGLTIKTRTGKLCDMFRGRIIYPIINASKKVIAFGGRIMEGDGPKYINTGDTPIYNKRANLYGINLQKASGGGEMIMVEGYMDAISLYAAGITNVVASLGTALTSGQARLLKRYCSKVFISYDGDAAGQNATMRGLDILAAEGLEVRVIVIPDDLDPDDYVRKFGADAYLALRDSSLALNAYKLERMAAGFELDTPDGREAFAKSACRFVSGLDPVQRERYIPFIVRKSGFEQSTVEAQCSLSSSGAQNSIGNNRNTKIAEKDTDGGTRASVERLLICCMASSKEASEAAALMIARTPTAFTDPALERIAREICVAWQNGPVDEALLLSRLGADSGKLAMALSLGGGIDDAMATADDCIRRITALSLKHELTSLASSIAPSSADYDPSAVKRYLEIQHQLKELTSVE